MASAILNDIKAAIRVKSDSSNIEVEDMIQACKKELEIKGVYVKDETEPLAKQAIKLYCKGHYGYDENAEKFLNAYEKLSDSMALSGDFKKEISDGSKVDLEQPGKK